MAYSCLLRANSYKGNKESLPCSRGVGVKLLKSSLFCTHNSTEIHKQIYMSRSNSTTAKSQLRGPADIYRALLGQLESKTLPIASQQSTQSSLSAHKERSRSHLQSGLNQLCIAVWIWEIVRVLWRGREEETGCKIVQNLTEFEVAPILIAFLL